MIILVTLIAVAAAQNSDIIYKYSKKYELIWNDAGSYSRDDGSVWRISNGEPNFCSLGDVATRSWHPPKTIGVLVSQLKSGALAHPNSFTQMWTSRGTGAHKMGAFYKMNPPTGYICLGGVAMNSYYNRPNRAKYCCVRDKYVVPAGRSMTWSSRGSGFRKDVSLWTVSSGGDSHALDAGNFVVSAGFFPPYSPVYLLKADGHEVREG
jgi:hypothetical protein